MDKNFKLLVLLQWFLALARDSMGQTAVPVVEHFIRNSTDFKIVTEGLFVDKTLLTKEVIKGFNLVTSPPGFGKTTNLDMLRRFFELPINTSTGEVMVAEESENYKLFKNDSLQLRIAKEEEFFQNHFAKYPVILLDLSIDNGVNFKTVLSGVRKRLSECFLRYEWLFRGIILDLLSEKDRNFYEIIAKPTESPDNILEYVTRSLHFLGHILNEHFKVKPILLIDEFDSPMRRTVEHNGDIEETHELIDSMFYNILHQAPTVVSFAFVNGVFSMLRASGTARAMLNTHAFLDEHKYVPFYGFSEDEVLNRYITPLLVEREEVIKLKKYYLGYLKDRNTYVNLYAPVDMVSYFYNRIELHSVETVNYMTRGPIFANFENLVRDNYIRDVLVDFMWFRSLNFPLITSLTVSHLQKLSSVMNEQNSSIRTGGELVLPYLYEHGLVSPAQVTGTFRAPNDEIRLFFKKYVNRYFFYNRPIDLVNAMQKLCNVMSLIIDNPSPFIHAQELTDIELYAAAYLRSFEHLSLKNYGVKATEADFRVMLYFVSWRVSKLSKWKYQAVAETNGNLKKRKIDMMLIGYKNIMLFLRIRYTTLIKPEFEDIGNHLPLGRKPAQLKYLDLLISPELDVKALTSPSRNFSDFENKDWGRVRNV